MNLPENMKFIESCSKYTIGGKKISKKGTVTHKKSTIKNKVTLVWKSGGKNYGKIRLYATIAQGYGRVWIMKSMVGVDF